MALVINILIVIIMGLSVYVIAVGIFKFIKGIPTKDSVKIVNDFLWKIVEQVSNLIKEILKEFSSNNTPPPIQFPVFIGIDESGTQHADVIENAFSDVLSKFLASYFKCVTLDSSRIYYHFSVSGFIPMIQDELEILKFLKRITESAVHRYIHKMQPYFQHVPNLVSISLIGDCLTVGVARNFNGIQENINFQSALRQRLESEKLGEVKNAQKPLVDEELQTDLFEMSGE